MKALIQLILSACALLTTACTTKVAIDPMTGEAQIAEYRAGYFYAPIDATVDKIFKEAIGAIDSLGYFRTGELHTDTTVTIYARQVGDQKVTVHISPSEDEDATAQSEIRIRIGKLGNLSQSQVIFASINEKF